MYLLGMFLFAHLIMTTSLPKRLGKILRKKWTAMFYLTVLTKHMLKPAAFNYKELISRSYDRIMVRLSKNKSEKSSYVPNLYWKLLPAQHEPFTATRFRELLQFE